MRFLQCQLPAACKVGSVELVHNHLRCASSGGCPMSLTLYSHPFASYCQKVLIALWENEIPFPYRHLEEPGAAEERAALWPLGRFPVLVDDGRTVAESSIIIEYLDLHHAGPVRLLPDDRDAALEVRFMDRFFENHVMTPMQKPVL